MHILVLNGSPAADNSVTLHTALYVEKFFPEDEFTYINGKIESKNISVYDYINHYTFC